MQRWRAEQRELLKCYSREQILQSLIPIVDKRKKNGVSKEKTKESGGSFWGECEKNHRTVGGVFFAQCVQDHNCMCSITLACAVSQ